MERIMDSKRDWYLLPILLVLAVAPLVVFLKMVAVDPGITQFWTNASNSAADFFSYYKAGLICISAVIMLASCLLKGDRGGLREKSMLVYYLPVAAYLFFIVLSSVFSKYPIIARNGFIDRYEGIFVLAAYMVILLCTMNFHYGNSSMKILSAGLFLSAGLIGTIGILQFFGFDFFRTYFGQRLILPAKFHQLAGSLNFTQEPYTIYSTLHSGSYAGSYMAMLFPISIVVFVFAKKLPNRIAAGLFSCLMLAGLVGSRSMAGYVGGILALAVILLLLRKNILQNIKQMTVLAVGYAAVFAVLYAVSGGAVFSGEYSEIQKAVYKEARHAVPVNLEDIKLEGKSFSIISKTETLQVIMSGESLLFRDKNGNSLEYVKNDDEITFPDKRYSAYKLTVKEGDDTIEVAAGTMTIRMAWKPDGFGIAGERGIFADDIRRPEKAGFAGMEKFASSRGYIWSRALPLLKKTLLVGNGPDTFVTAFPQYDYIGKLRAYSKADIIVDKPYNLYLQTGINTGVISLIALLALFGIYFVSSLKIYLKKQCNTLYDIAGIAAFVAFCGYAAAGLFNDSTVSVAPVFWAILGIGIACNRVNSKKSTEQTG